MRRIIPYPFLFLALLGTWLLLTSFSAGQLVLGVIVATFATHAMTALEPPKVRIRSWLAVLRLLGRVTVDIVRSNIAVLRIILFDRAERRSDFVAVPLELRDRMGLALLGVIVTCAPGTAWLEYDTDSGIALIHVLDFTSNEAMIAIIKGRYETLLLEIFE